MVVKGRDQTVVSSTAQNKKFLIHFESLENRRDDPLELHGDMAREIVRQSGKQCSIGLCAVRNGQHSFRTKKYSFQEDNVMRP
jgi:hypothetical protein